MEPFKLKPRKGPEAKIQADLIKLLQSMNWMVKHTHGSLYQSGFPDLYVCHKRYGQRWIEVKNKDAYRWTAAQYKDFPMFLAHGVGIWVLTAATKEEVDKLFKPPNILEYWK